MPGFSRHRCTAHSMQNHKLISQPIVGAETVFDQNRGIDRKINDRRLNRI